ncbi:MAG TPA: hypothetical protein VEX69_04520 [Candidatus Limnocylindria bacterium]|nr:hypothetical protein [Candidatus Limnocylindria bacterium]
MNESTTGSVNCIAWIVPPFACNLVFTQIDFDSSWMQMFTALAVVASVLALNVPWKKLREGTEEERRSTRRNLGGMCLGMVVLGLFAYEVMIKNKWGWFVDHAWIALVLAILFFLLKRRFARRNS